MRTGNSLMFLVLVIALAAGWSPAVQADGRVPLPDVPEQVRRAALEAVPGIRLEQGELLGVEEDSEEAEDDEQAETVSGTSRKKGQAPGACPGLPSR